MKKFFTETLVRGTILLLAVFLVASCNSSFQQEKDSIHIAFAGPLSGEGAAAGRLMTRAIQLYLNHLNERGGINGKKVQLSTFDDQNDCLDHANQPATAKQVANQIVEDNQVLAVIGHWYSSCSIAAGEIYKKYHIPAITPGSENIKVTQDNEWYFRNIYNSNASGQFLANYVKKVFRQNTVTIIHESADYGSYLASVFEETSRKLDMEVKRVWKFENADQNLDDHLRQLVNQELVPIRKEAGVILLAVQAQEGVKLVKLIKEAEITNPIIAGSSFSEDTFQHGFDQFPLEKANPGFYINDIYVATPLIFDTANQQAQKFRDEYQQVYQEEPDWSAAYAYDTIAILAEAIKRANLEAKPETRSLDRKKLRDTLASFTKSEDAILGVTGYNYFDDQRDAQKAVSLGVYKNRNSVSALTQLQVMRSPNDMSDLADAVKREDVLQINDKYMYKTNVVYTGIELREISDLEIPKLICTLDFYIWFRFQGKFEPQQIQFVNAVDPKEAEKSFKEKPITYKSKDNITYRIYRVKSRFKIDFLPEYAYKQHVLGIRFHHRDLTRNNLIYVTDVLGLGLSEETPLVKRMNKNQVLSVTSGWTIDNARFFQDTAKKSSLGEPKYLNAPQGLVEYSQFNAVMWIMKDEFTFRGKIPYQYSYHLVALSGILIFLLALAGRKFKPFLKYFWFLQVLCAAVLLMSGEVIVVTHLAERANWYSYLISLILIFDILWWVIGAFFLTTAAERFVWTPLEQQIGAIPNIIRHFFALLIYLSTIIAIVVFVYERTFTSLLATSGMLAMIIGLAVKINIANIFSGMVINIERPFRIGDWVRVGAFEEAEVIDINWRATRVQTRANAVVSLSNSVAIESAITNFYYPTNVFWLWPTVYVHPKHSPERVKKVLLDALLSANTILKDPAPVIIFTGLNEWAASYWVAFCADDYERKYYILAEVWHRIWIHLERAAIQPAVRRQEIQFFRGEENSQMSFAEEDFFNSLLEETPQPRKGVTYLPDMNSHDSKVKRRP